MMIEDLAKYLNDQSFGSYKPNEVGGDIFLGIYPDKPDNCIYIRNTTGLDGDFKNGWDVVGVQIICRGKENLATMKKAKNIFNTLDGFGDRPMVAGGLFVMSILGSNSGPIPIGKDGQGRYEFSLNLLVECERRNEDA